MTIEKQSPRWDGDETWTFADDSGNRGSITIYNGVLHIAGEDERGGFCPLKLTPEIVRELLPILATFSDTSDDGQTFGPFVL